MELELAFNELDEDTLDDDKPREEELELDAISDEDEPSTDSPSIQRTESFVLFGESS